MGKFRANLDPISSDRPLAPMMPELGYITAWRMYVVGGDYPSYFQMIRKVVTQDITIHYISGRPCFGRPTHQSHVSKSVVVSYGGLEAKRQE